MMKRFAWNWLAVLLWASMSVGAANAALLDEARVVAATESLSAMAPESKLFTITAAGSHTLTLTDLGEQNASADAFSSLSIVISQRGQFVTQLSVPSGVSTVTDSVSLSVGQYQAQVLGVTTGASLYLVELENGSNVDVLSEVGTVVVPPSGDYSTLQQVLALTVGQSYTVTLTDRAFPAALDSMALIVTESGVPAGNCNLLAAESCSFVATDDNASLTVLASNGGAGLYSVKVTNTSTGAVVYAATLPVGDMPEPVSVTLPAADSYALTSVDLKTPVALSAFKLALVQGAELLATQTAVGSAPGFTASSGAASLYVIATPATGSPGLYGVQLKRGSTSIYNQVNSVEDSGSTDFEGYVFTATLPSAGAYNLELRDFAFPQSFTALTASVSQGGALLGTSAIAGSLNISNAQAGEIVIAVLPTPGAGGAGLFGLSLTAAGGGSPILEVTQGVGGSFTSEVVTLSTTHYALSYTDFSAPLSLDSLLVAVTRGNQQVGTYYAGGTIAFDATAGDYTLSYITKAKSAAGYGMYGVSLVAVPVITLSASATSIASGGSATLTWGATDAAACTASGGWSGSKAGSGATTVGPLTADATFTLTCTNAAGSTAASTIVTVQAAASSKKKGGGAWSLAWLFAFGALGMARRLRSRGD